MRRHVRRARDGEGPSLLVANTYRFAGHSRADKASYRPAGEAEQWRLRDPVVLRRKALVDSGAASGADLDALDRHVEEQIQDVVRRTSAAPEPPVHAMFRNVWAPDLEAAGGAR
jgi:pyruvate dehydrogenase E1 component alpha subunit